MDKIDFKTVFSLVTFLVTGLFWIFTINGIPARVTALEADVKDLKMQLVQNSVKTDIILDDVKYLKQVAMEKSHNSLP